ncbi:MAG: agmatine deiminase family protein [Bacteroidales bacterium]|nr:agmatine deiminase family protein [Bacteroidales bacterium]
MTPKESGYRFPAEWEKHVATWLTYPHNEASFPGMMDRIYNSYLQFIKAIVKSEIVRINVPDLTYKQQLVDQLKEFRIDDERVEIFIHPSDDVWCRDHGPCFVINNNNPNRKAIVNWGFNAWGGKYPYENDNNIPLKVAAHYGYPVFTPGIIMEGGSIDVNSKGTLLTTTACLLNKNRNPQLSQDQIEIFLMRYYNVEQIVWLGDGIAGDDTDGHVDDITRFASDNVIVTAVEVNRNDENYQPLQDNLKQLKKLRLIDGKQPDIVEIPMPDPVYYEGNRLPASYANFYITNEGLIVPNFRCKNDDKAMLLLQECFPGKEITGIDSKDIVWGFGSFHCLSQQEPE